MEAYCICIIIGCLCAAAAYKYAGLPKRSKDPDAFIAGGIGVILGAKIPVWISYGLSWETVVQGKSFAGALIGAFLGLNLYKRLSGRTQFSFGSGFVIPLAIVAGFGKIGCFLAGCCAGRKTGMAFPEFYPAQLVESAFQFTAAFVLWRLYKRGMQPDRLFPLYAACYLTMRFFVEFIRTEPVVFAGLTVYQIAALAFIPVFVFLFKQRGTYGNHPDIG